MPDQLVVSTNISHQTIQKQLNRSDTKTSPTESANCSSSNLQDNNKEDSTQVDDPVKAFQEDLEMEGYTGMSQLSSPIQLRKGGMLIWDFMGTFPGNQGATLKLMSEVTFIKFC